MGTEIYHKDDHLPQIAQQVAKYLALRWEPFSIRGYRDMAAGKGVPKTWACCRSWASCRRKRNTVCHRLKRWRRKFTRRTSQPAGAPS
jgi:hypothetical protein